MWALTLALLLGAASADHSNAWDTENEYHYTLESRSLTGLPEVSDQYSGVMMRATLKIQPKNEDMLLAQLSKVEYAPVHMHLPHGWDSMIPESDQKFMPLTTSRKSFGIKVENGIIKELMFDKDVPTWEVNIHKSVISQLQIDTQGENMRSSVSNQPPSDKIINAMFKTMEDSVGGNCEVLYDINSLPRPVAELMLQHIPGKQFKSEGELIEIMKTMDYEKCKQRVAVHFGMPGNFDFEPASNKKGEFFSKSSISEMTLTGTLTAFTLHSSVTTEKVIMSPTVPDSKSSVVMSRVNLTLSHVQPKSNPWPVPSNPESVGNLAYTYEQPFSPEGEDRMPGKPTMSSSWKNLEVEVETTSEESLHKNHFDDSSDSGSDEDDLNADMKPNLQPKPTLSQPPQYPILPLFIANKGKAVSSFDSVDIVDKTKKLANEIASDLDDPSAIPEEQTLEKFTILVGILKTMNIDQLRVVKKELYDHSKNTDENDQQQMIMINARKVFRDAMTSAGTGPALVMIIELIQERLLDALEVMNVVSTLPKTSKEPTPEYLDAFFKMAAALESQRKDNSKGASIQEALKDDAVSTAAILAFTELLRYAQVNQLAVHNRFPVHVFGNFIPKSNNALLRDYLPYLIEKMEQGIEENSPRATVYIRALGNVAHPRTLAVFEPYLEGKKPSTVYQRQMMVLALDKLADDRPKVVRGLAYRIYQNTGESFKVRGLAVFLAMKTKPPLAMLQRMAQFTNYDVSKHVNSIVKSLIEGGSDSEIKENEEFARDARAARAFLTPEMYGLEYSTAVIMDNYLKEMSIGYAGQISWIYGEDSAMPQGIYKAFDASYGGIKVPKDETGIMVSSVKDFYKNMKRLLKNFIDEKKDHPMKMKGKSPTEAVVEMLDIEGKKKDKFEMFFLSRDMYSSSYFVMGEDMLNPIPEEYIRLAAKSLKSGKSFNMMSLQNFEVAVGFPLATGLPFTGEFQMPRLRQLSGKMKISTGSDLPIGSASKLDKMIAAMDIRMVISQKGQSRFGFVTPFDGTQYVTGTDKNIHFHIPMSAKVNCDVAKKEIRMKLMPMNKNKAVKMVHWSAMPFTARKNIEDLKPTASMGNPGMMIMKKDEEEQSMTIIGSEKRGLSFKITETKSGESSSVLEKMTDLDTIWQNVLFPMVDRKVEPYSIDVLSIPSPSSDPEINFVVGWDTMSKNELSDNSSEMSHRWMSKPEIIEPLDKDLASPFRKREMMKEALKELPAADAVAVDIALELPGEDKMNYIMTTALATSKINEKFKALVYMRSGGTQKAWEACATAQGSSPAVPPFEPEMMESEKLQRGMDIKIGIGISCKSGVQSVLHARQWQSKEFQEAIHKNKKMYESMGIPKTLMDRATIIVHEADEEMDKWEKHPKNMKRLIGNSKALHQLVSNFESQTNSEDERNERYVRLDGSIEPGTKKLRLDLKAPMMGLDYTASTELIPGILPMMLLESDATYGSGYIKKIGRRGSVHKSIPPEDVCLIEKDFVTTFDGLEYPLELSKCWCIAVTSVPEQESKLSKPAIESDKQTSITIRKDESDDSKREISVTLGSEEIQMTKPNSEIMVKINRKMIDWSSNEYLIKEGEDDELVIVKLPGEAVSIESEKYGLKIIFDGRRTLIEMDDKYRDSVRGLCGNFDSESSNDLLTPHNRLSPKPQDFASLYVLPEKECQSSSKGVREMEKSLPVDKPRLTDVVSDREAGRPNHHGKWGSSDPFSSRYSKKLSMMFKTKVVPVGDTTCFSLRPLPTCAPGAEPVRVKTVLFPVYCLPNGESAKRMSDRIRKGANPDLSQKPPSMKLKLQIAQHCSPAA